MAKMFLYRGVELPDVYDNEFSKEYYPYRLLSRRSDKYDLYIATFPFVLSDETIVAASSGEYYEGFYYSWAGNPRFGINLTEYTVESGDELGIDPGTVFWTDHDIHTTFDDSVFFAASEPIPVEETPGGSDIPVVPIPPDTPSTFSLPKTGVNWSDSMQQTFEYYEVDPGTWRDKRKLNLFKSSSITRDSEVETRGSATFDITDTLNECYVRVYLVTLQNELRESHPLGTFLVQSPSSSFDGKILNTTVDGYTPLIELKEKKPPLGYSLFKDDPIMEKAYMITRENVRAPVIKPASDATKTLNNDFVANVDETWISYTSDLVMNAEHTIELDELGRIMYMPIQELESLQPVWTYTDDNSSIMYPQITIDRDMYAIPNVVEVAYSNGKTQHYVRVENNDPNSPVSIVNRGREIPYRDTSPSFPGTPSYSQVYLYAKRLLKQLSTLKCTIKYTHGYCPVRLGDCVRIDYKRSGFKNIKAKVVRQTIKCEPGCPVEETAVFTNKLWGG